MGDFDPFAFVGKPNAVFADHVAGPNGGKADFVPFAFAGDAVTGKNTVRFQIAA